MRFNNFGIHGTGLLPGVSVRKNTARKGGATKRPKPRRGFSLVEVMIVVVIIGLMAGVVAYATSGYPKRAKKQRARSDIAVYSGAVDSFYLAKGRYPDNQEGLKALVPENFIKMVQNDPWGHPYQYVQPGKGGAYRHHQLWRRWPGGRDRGGCGYYELGCGGGGVEEEIGRLRRKSERNRNGWYKTAKKCGDA